MCRPELVLKKAMNLTRQHTQKLKKKIPINYGGMRMSNEYKKIPLDVDIFIDILIYLLTLLLKDLFLIQNPQ